MSILKRTVLYYKSDDGQYRFPGWAVTITTEGACLEPFNISDRFVTGLGQSIADFDPSDIMTRVDELQPINDLTDWAVMSFGETMPTCGGDLLPRTYIKEGNNRGSS
jgi:hypothetical protein